MDDPRIRSLLDGSLAERAAAAEQIAHDPESARTCAVPLVKSASDDAESIREWVVAALEGIERPSASDAPELAQLVSSTSLNTAYWAATLLGRIGETANGECESLAAVVNEHPENSVRERAAWALGRIGMTSETVISALSHAAEHGHARLSRLASQALEELRHGS